MQRSQKQKIILTVAIVSMVFLSLVLAIIMSNNFKKDDSVERMKLTKEYKLLKDTQYSFDKIRGLALYKQLCMDCHRSKEIEVSQLSDEKALLSIVLFGKGNMPAHEQVPNTEMAHVLNYIRQEYDQNLEMINPVDIVIFKVNALQK